MPIFLPAYVISFDSLFDLIAIYSPKSSISNSLKYWRAYYLFKLIDSETEYICPPYQYHGMRLNKNTRFKYAVL